MCVFKPPLASVFRDVTTQQPRFKLELPVALVPLSTAMANLSNLQGNQSGFQTVLILSH